MFFVCLGAMVLIFTTYILLPAKKGDRLSVIRVILVTGLYCVLNLAFCQLLYLTYFTDQMSGRTFCLLIITHIILYIIYFLYVRSKKKKLFKLHVLIVVCYSVFLFCEWPLWALDKEKLKVSVYKEAEELGDTNIFVISYKSYLMTEEYELEDEIVIQETQLNNWTRYPYNPRGIVTFSLQEREGFDDSITMAETLIEQTTNEPIKLESRKQFEERDVVGPSAGLGFYLSGFVQEGYIQTDKKFGVTGSIEEDGTVYKVGGVYEKTVAAIMDELDYLIVPKENEQEALDAVADKNASIEIKAVSTVEEALDFVKGIE